MHRVQPRGTLKQKFSISNVITSIIDRLKEDLQNKDFQSIRNDPYAILYLMELIDKCLMDSSIIDRKTAKKIDRSDLLIEILKVMFPNINEQEIAEVKKQVDYNIDLKLVKKPSFFFSVISPLYHLFCPEVKKQ
jgi:predicted CopG family antitoxin